MRLNYLLYIICVCMGLNEALKRERTILGAVVVVVIVKLLQEMSSFREWMGKKGTDMIKFCVTKI